MSQSGKEGRSSGVELSTADPEEMLNMRGKHDNEGHRQYLDNVWNQNILQVKRLRYSICKNWSSYKPNFVHIP